jgi:uncharacterized membrane protein YeiH
MSGGQLIEGQFHLPIVFDLVAMFLGAVTGALIGLSRGYDIVSCLAMAWVLKLLAGTEHFLPIH